MVRKRSTVGRSVVGSVRTRWTRNSQSRGRTVSLERRQMRIEARLSRPTSWTRGSGADFRIWRHVASCIQLVSQPPLALRHSWTALQRPLPPPSRRVPPVSGLSRRPQTANSGGLAADRWIAFWPQPCGKDPVRDPVFHRGLVEGVVEVVGCVRWLLCLAGRCSSHFSCGLCHDRMRYITPRLRPPTEASPPN